MPIKIHTEIQPIIASLEEQAGRLGGTLPAVGSVLYGLSSQLRYIANHTEYVHRTELLEGRGESARALLYAVKYKNLNESLPPGVGYTVPDFAFQPLKTPWDLNSEAGDQKPSPEPMGHSDQWGFALLMHLHVHGQLNMPAGMYFDAERREVSVRRTDRARGWDTTLKLVLPKMTPAPWGWSLSTTNLYEGDELHLASNYLGKDWVMQNVVVPLYKANELDVEQFLDNPMYTLSQVIPWLEPLAEQHRLDEVAPKLPTYIDYRLRDIYIDQGFTLTNPWTNKSIPVTGTFGLHAALKGGYLSVDRMQDKVPLQLRLGAEQQEVLFHNTPFNTAEVPLHKLPYLYQKAIIAELEQAVRRGLEQQLTLLKEEYPSAFVESA